MLEELVGRVFAARNAAHLAHWRTKSYAQHVALGSFYDGAVEKLDAIVEAAQGSTGKLVDGVKLDARDDKTDIIKHLSEDCDWIADNRAEISKGVTAIENLLDDLCGLYLSTIYKLENLS